MTAQVRGLIDIHHHVVPKEYVDRLRSKGITKSLGVRFPDSSVRKSLGVMDGNGVEAAIVSISAPGVYFQGIPDSLEFARETACQMNDFCAELIHEHPGRFEVSRLCRCLMLMSLARNGSVH